MQLKRIAYTVCLSAGTVLLSGVVALAQAPGSPQQQPTMPSQQQPTTPTNPGAGNPDVDREPIPELHRLARTSRSGPL